MRRREFIAELGSAAALPCADTWEQPPRDPNDDDEEEDEEDGDAKPDEDEPAVIREPDE
jgi:hypothetical protein